MILDFVFLEGILVAGLFVGLFLVFWHVASLMLLVYNKIHKILIVSQFT